MNDVDIAWAAGLFEGEGCFMFSHGQPWGVKIQMADKDVLERMLSLFGGHLKMYDQSKRRKLDRVSKK